MNSIPIVVQLLTFGACSLVFSSILAYGEDIKSEASTSTTVSYPRITTQTRLTPQTSKQLSRLNDFNTAASSNSYAPPSTQPSIYHSIIDHTASRPAAAIQTSTATVKDLHTAAGHHHGHAHGKYYEYRAVPKKKTWKFGYKRGNHKHTISRHEHGKAGKHPHFKTKVKWHDKKSKGKGIHLWDYNHHDKKHYHHG